MELTKLRAKRISLLLWSDIVRKNKYTEKKQSKYYHYVKGFFLKCPLCQLFHKAYGECGGCPLKSCNEKSFYYKFNKTKNIKYAKKILNKIKKWKV